MTTNLNEVEVNFGERKLKIRVNDEFSFAIFDLEIRNPLIAKIETIGTLFLRGNDSTGSIDRKIKELFPKLKTIKLFKCFMQPSAMISLLGNEPPTISGWLDLEVFREKGFNFIPQEMDGLFNFMNMRPDLIKSINFLRCPFGPIWDCLKNTDLKHFALAMKDEDNLRQFLSKALVEGFPNRNRKIEFWLDLFDTKDALVQVILPLVKKFGKVSVDGSSRPGHEDYNIHLKISDEKRIYVHSFTEDFDHLFLKYE